MNNDNNDLQNKVIDGKSIFSGGKVKGGNGGGSGMDKDKFATKEELHHTQELLIQKMDANKELFNTKFNVLSVKLNWVLGILATLAAGAIAKMFL